MNPSLAPIYEDGSYAAAEASSPIRILPRPYPAVLGGGFLAKQEFTCAAYDRRALHEAGPIVDGWQTYLFDQSEGVADGFGHFVWERTWGNIPAGYNICEIYPYPFQSYYSIGANNYVFSIVQVRNARVAHTFHVASNPHTIAVARLPRVIVVANIIFLYDGFVNLGPGVQTIACDDELVHYGGHIWMKIHKEIIT